MNDKERIVHYAKDLKLGIVKDIIDDVVSDAVQNQWDYWHFLCELLRQEAEHRAEVRKYQRIRKAGFPQMKYIQELVLEDMPEDAKKLIPELGTLNFIKEGRNIVMYGNPGTGNTHTAIGLGIKACMEGYSVYFTTVPHLLTQIREAKNSRTLQLLEARFKKFDLVICDEMGYVSFDKEGAELLFSHLSLRAGLRSIIITTNLPFTRWEEIIKDKVLCSALVDRLCYKAFLMNMKSGPFFNGYVGEFYVSIYTRTLQYMLCMASSVRRGVSPATPLRTGAYQGMHFGRPSE